MGSKTDMMMMMNMITVGDISPQSLYLVLYGKVDKNYPSIFTKYPFSHYWTVFDEHLPNREKQYFVISYLRTVFFPL